MSVVEVRGAGAGVSAFSGVARICRPTARGAKSNKQVDAAAPVGSGRERRREEGCVRPLPRRFRGGRRPLRRRARKEHLEQMSSCEALVSSGWPDYLRRPVGQILIRSASTEALPHTVHLHFTQCCTCSAVCSLRYLEEIIMYAMTGS